MDEPERTIIQSSAASDGSAVVDAIDGRINRARDNMVGSGERITVFSSVSVCEIEDERAIAVLLHVGYAGNEGASGLARECPDFGERAVTGLIWPNDLAGDVAADVLPHAAALRGGRRQRRRCIARSNCDSGGGRWCCG